MLFRACLTLLFATQIASPVLAAPPPDEAKNFAITERAKVDDDFRFQGEYAGQIDGQPAGMQVIARGDGKFEVVTYAGGLPGAGAFNRGKSSHRTTGQRTGEVLSIDENYTIEERFSVQKKVLKEVEIETADGPKTVTREEFIAETATRQIKKFASYRIDGRNVTVADADGVVTGSLQKVHRSSPTLGVEPPWAANVLFDGSQTWHFSGARLTDRGLLMEGPDFKTPYRNFMLHLEFKLPYMPYATGQARSNSGVYLQSRYEVQILDSFGLDGKFNECGALYRYKTPDVNMCFPPLVWQTYDIRFRAAEFDKQGEKTRNARITVWHNGVKVQDDFEIEHKTGAGKQEGPDPIVTKLQNHRNPVRFRNIWIIDYDEPQPSTRFHPGYRDWSPDQMTLQISEGLSRSKKPTVPRVYLNGLIR